ncbi:Werner syndrome ATP-dependent helicase-like [Mizuhopecten yessoensis]|uniref:Werner syndrome ATP-dependent helicase-like n=1 Tax=Mizuhopecten yessoensis TaxID=6573 RepID=A0A210QZ78_MIZYE|nr:Werner syndrome ATP-dependent helicase-like [Mizuhopecten yessoensis]
MDGIKDSSHAFVEMFQRSIHDESKTIILRNIKDPDSNLRCLIAIVVLGMGIQIDDVDIMMHLGSPKSILSYWQEMGRKTVLSYLGDKTDPSVPEVCNGD